jgi:DNA-binding GntR family transcriptional regulator
MAQDDAAWLSAEWAIDDKSAIPTYVQVAALVRAQIIAYGLEQGAAAPSEAQLAARLGVSKETARQAYKLLDELGYTRTKRGVGHFVAKTHKLTILTPKPDSKITARPATADERLAIGLVPGVPVLVVEEPGKHPIAYDATRTVVSFIQPRLY